MLLTLVTTDAISTLHLPRKPTGRYWVAHPGTVGEHADILSVEGRQSGWYVKSTQTASLLDWEGVRADEVRVEPGAAFEVLYDPSGERLLLRCDQSSDDRRTFSHYILPPCGVIEIGRGADADLRFENRFVSGRHARLVVAERSVRVEDLGSANGTYLNGHRVADSAVVPGDVISIAGLTIVVGGGFVAINNPDGLVSCNERTLSQVPARGFEKSAQAEVEESSPGVAFFRSPRFKRDIKTAAISIDAPPQPDSSPDMPLMMMLGPAMTMGLASVLTGAFAVSNVLAAGGSVMQAMPTLVMSGSMMMGMVLWPVLSRRYEKRSRERREAHRQQKYLSYLDQCREEVEVERAIQGTILHENIVARDECTRRIRARDRSLWERTVAHNDFLRLRLGIGEWPLDADIKYPERRFSLDDDELQEAMHALAEEPRALKDVPVSLALAEQQVVGLIGDREMTSELLRNLIIQIVALHSYDELKLVLICGEREIGQWEFVRWLPHVWTDDHTFRFVATSSEDAKGLGAFLEREIARRESRGYEEGARDVPHYVVIAIDRDLANKTEAVNRILKQEKSIGFSLITRVDELKNLPKECRSVVELNRNESRIFDKEAVSGEYCVFVPDPPVDEDLFDLTQCLANTYLETAASTFQLPESLTFLQLLGVGAVEHLNALARWTENNPVLSIEAPVGLDTRGQVLSLDVHEKHHGPHGLIAGMTGSGKSEFVMTFILSLAVNYHPHELAFVLIDYKGGGMANAFVGLPHVVGTITNLDGAAVNRSLISIQSELKRRQAIFNEASQLTGESSIDIYAYQRLYRARRVAEPLPHLLIVSDEFAELKTQQPEFMSQLVSAARIGRSLGVHLVLATQKPSGVVDDQIWSNTRFRVCLKVQERTDSQEVIKRPDAAELSQAGRFFLQVGFNERFELGQSAWTGAPYHPAERVETSYDDSIVLVNPLGQPVRALRPDKQQGMACSKQLDEVAEYLAQLAADEQIAAQRLWLEPIPEVIYADEIGSPEATPFVLRPVVGLYDDPMNQQQEPLEVQLTQLGNAVVYGASGSGKTSFITTLVHSLITRHSPYEVSLYLLDFASETLRAFEAAPHVGDVLLSHEDEKVDNLFKVLSTELTRRKKLFGDFGGDYRSYLESSGEKLGSVVVVIHNYSAFTELHEDKEEAIAQLSREGAKYGIYFVLTCASTGGIRYRVLQNFRQLFVLQLNDATEYSGVLGNTEGVLPSALKGRGIVRLDRVYEFQTACSYDSSRSEFEQARCEARSLAEAWEGPSAKRVPILPDAVTPDYLDREIAKGPLGLIPIGIDKSSLEPVYFDFGGPFISLVLSQSTDGAHFAQALAEVLSRTDDETPVVLDVDRHMQDHANASFEYAGPDDIESRVERLFHEMVRRNNLVADARESGASVEAFPKQVYIVLSVTRMLERLSHNGRKKFAELLDRCDSSLGTSFIFFDSSASASSLLYESWMKKHVNAANGIWIGEGFGDQFTFQVSKSGQDVYQEIGSDFGWVLAKGRPSLVKLLRVVKEVEGGE